jgi:CBS domain-containing protein
VPGRADWFANGLPGEGAQATRPHLGEVARRDVPRCRLAERIGAVRDRVREAGWDTCVVVNEEQVVLGLLLERELAADPTATAEQVMRSGPATFRPDELVADVLERMKKRGVMGVLVTLSDGILLGLMRREDAERAMEG